MILASMHFNSSQGYSSAPMIMVRGDKLDLIDTIYTFDENLCGYARKQDVDFRAIAEKAPYAVIKVTVTDATLPSEEQCDEPPPPSSTDISATYHWDNAASRYVADSDALHRLADENARRF